jgi:sigma-E factor negative regulatory protein RseC
MRSIGYVGKIGPDSAEVLLGKHAQCSGCGACIAASDTRERKIAASNDAGAAEGDRVEIEISPGRLVTAAFMMFILPILLALAGAYVGFRLGPGLGLPAAAAAIVLGCLAFTGSFLLLKGAERAGRRAGLPRIVRILNEDETEGRC